MYGPRPTRVRYRVLGWLCLMAALAYLCRNSLGVAESTIRADLSLTRQQSGWLMAAFFWSYAAFQVPGGLIGHVWGTRIALTLFVVTWSTATAMLGLATQLWMLLAAQLAMGAAQAGLFPCAVNSINDWIPASRRAFSTASLGASMQIGATTAAALTGYLIGQVNWRYVFLLYSVPGIVASIWFYTRFRNRPEEVSSVNQAELELLGPGDDQQTNRHESRAEPTPWLTILCRPTMWFLCRRQCPGSRSGNCG